MKNSEYWKNPCTAAPSTATLESVFTELEQLRIPRTSELVKKARKMGDIRFVSGVEARKQLMRTMFTSEVARTMFEDLGKNPFEPGKSEIRKYDEPGELQGNEQELRSHLGGASKIRLWD